jgi:hypothetical protein
MRNRRQRQQAAEHELAGEVTAAEREAVGRKMWRHAGVADEDAEQYTPAAVVARQRQIIVLLNGVRSLAIALLSLFVVFGVCGILLVDTLNETRTDTRDHVREQRLVLCDIYTRLDEVPPHDLGC